MNFLLPWTIYLTFAGAVVTWFVGARSAARARWCALGTTGLTLGLALVAAWDFVPVASLQTLVNVEWLWNWARFHLAVDGISLALVLLTGVAGVAGVLFSWNVERRAGDFFALFLMLLCGVYGVFLSADVFLLFVFYEIAIVPKYFLVAAWGSTNREYGAMKLVLYSFAGSALVLAGMLWMSAVGTHPLGAEGVPPVFDLAGFVERGRMLPVALQVPLFALLFTGFAVLAGMFPFHTWAPTGHVAAPTGASMLLAGVVMKLGAYGCLRVALPAFPLGFGVFQPLIAWLAVAGIVYAGLIALVQRDFKFVIGYSSVSHMGFVLLGLAAASPMALGGAVLQMFSHGVVAGLLFGVVGRMVYERTHSRDLQWLRTLPLARLMPFAAVVFVLAAMASMGMPGFSGFPAELAILSGVWRHEPVWALVAVVGIPVGAAFMLRAVQLAFLGGDGGGGGRTMSCTPVTLPEKVGAGLLLGVSVGVGLRPDVLMGWIAPALESPWFNVVRNGGAQ